MVIFPLAPDQTIAQMWSNGARGGRESQLTELKITSTTADWAINNYTKNCLQRISDNFEKSREIHRNI